jgi:predicted Zn-dependent protease with MMP-like domain
MHWPPWNTLLDWAHAEVARTLCSLPADLRARAEPLPVVCEPYPSEDLVADGVDADLLGLFVGEELAATGATPVPMPAQIFLFLENLWDYADGDRQVFLEEVRTTYLHELGHYLGLDEADLEERGLG